MISTFSELLDLARHLKTKSVAVAVAQDRVVIEALRQAREDGIADSILIGDKARIVELGGGDFEIVHVTDERECVTAACQMVREKKVDMIMKGHLPTPLFLRAILDRENGLRPGRTLSHCAVLEVEAYPKLIFVTDGGMCLRPDFRTKLDIAVNAIELAHSLGIEEPRVAVLASVEKVDPKVEETVDASELRRLWERGEIKGAIVDGPLALDLAVSREAAARKGVESQVAGDADVLLVPDVPAGNIFAKGLIYLAGAKAGGLVLGAECPVVLLSRADEPSMKLNSIALGAVHSR